MGWDASSWGACEAISCGGGYDAQGDSEVCGETPSGYYSLVGSTERLSCSTVETLVGNSGWSSATGLAKGSECEWECNLGYKKNAAENDCISSESIDRFIITNAISVGEKGSKKKSTKDRVLQLSISGTSVAKWYVTHTSKGSGAGEFSPSDTSEAESANAWTADGTAPTTYTLPNSLSDGDYTLYLYAADGAGNVKEVPGEYKFYLDTSAPVLSIDSAPANPQIGGGSADFVLSATEGIAGASIGYEYCFGVGTACDEASEFSSVTDPSSFSFNLATGGDNTFGLKTMNFKVSDDHGHEATSVYAWSYHLCEGGSSEAETGFDNGVKERSCKGDGSVWNSWIVTSCIGGYYDLSGSCVRVTGADISAVNDPLKSTCSGEKVPNVGKTACIICQVGEHAISDNTGCTGNSKSCESEDLPLGASGGDHSWTGGKSGSWGVCIPTGCTGSYTFYDDVCYANSRICDLVVSINNVDKVVGSGTQAYNTNGAYSACGGATSCIGGYDDGGNSGNCEETPKGHYSETGSKERLSCLSTTSITRAIALESLPGNGYWSSGTGLVQDTDCSWACETGYKKNTGGTLCEAGESVSKFKVTGLTDVGSGIEATNGNSVSLAITGLGVSKWHVTDDASETYDDKKDTSSWTGTKPTSYDVQNVTEGEVTLYLWVAGLDGKVKTGVTSSNEFILDKSGPVISLGSKPGLLDGSGTVSFGALSVSDELESAGLGYKYCTATGTSGTLSCDLGVDGQNVNVGNFPLSVATDTVWNYYYIKFEVKDKLGQGSELSYTWQRTGCTPGDKDRPVIANGIANERTCGSSGSYPSVTVESCVGGYDDGDGDNDCEETESDYYSLAKDKSRKSCSGNPGDSEWTGKGHDANLGVSGSNPCTWTCEGGYTEDSGSCYKTQDACSDSTRSIASGTKGYIKGTGYATCEATSCVGGFVKDGVSCRVPEKGHYSKGGVETGCEAIGDSKWKVNPSSGLGSDMCDFDCNDGYKKDGRSCYESPEARDLTELANNVSKVIGEERRSYKVGTGYGPWSVASCIGGYHANSGNTNCVSNDCSSEIGDGSGARTVAGGTCQITSCAVDYYDSGVSDCEQVADGEWSAGNSKAKADCTGKPSDSGYTTRGGGVATGCSWACNGGYTEDSGSCHKTEDTCSDSGAHIATGTKTYSKGTGYGSCEPTSCASNYHIESGSCVSDSDGCVIVNGAGGKKWDGMQVVGEHVRR